MNTSIMSILLGILLFGYVFEIQGGYLPTILWDSRNFLFGCEDLTIYLKQDDILTLACPTDYLYSRQEKEKIKPDSTFERIYLVDEQNKDKFYNCNSTDTMELKTCGCTDKCPDNYLPYKELQMTLINTIKILQFQPEIEKTIYIFSTSLQRKENLDNPVNGSCQQIKGYYPLKLKIHKCKRGDVACENKVCTTMECYLKGCGRWNEWQAESTFYWNGTSCFQKSIRSCQTMFSCLGEKEKLDIVPEKNCTCTRCKEDCPSSSEMSSLFRISPTPSVSISSRSSPMLFSSSKCPECSCSTQTPLMSSLSSSNLISPMSTNELYSSKVNVFRSSANIAPPVSTQTVIVNQTVTKTEKVTETSYQVSTITKAGPATTVLQVETKIEYVTKSCQLSHSVSIQPTPKIAYVTRDISYDEKFYITVVSAIIGAILVAVFVMHACIAYNKGNKVKNPKVINVKEYHHERTTTHIETSSGKTAQNGTYTMLT